MCPVEKIDERVVMSRLVRLEEADDSFDIEFWNRVGTQGKLAAAWQMVQELVYWNPQYAPEPRLRRFHTLLKRRED